MRPPSIGLRASCLTASRNCFPGLGGQPTDATVTVAGVIELVTSLAEQRRYRPVAVRDLSRSTFTSSGSTRTYHLSPPS